MESEYLLEIGEEYGYNCRYNSSIDGSMERAREASKRLYDKCCLHRPFVSIRIKNPNFRIRKNN